MLKIRIFLSYNCYPLWIYDKKSNLIFNGESFANISPDYKELLWFLSSDIDTLCSDIQTLHDSLYINNSFEFTFLGDESIPEMLLLKEKLKFLYLRLAEKLDSSYVLEYENL